MSRAEARAAARLIGAIRQLAASTPRDRHWVVTRLCEPHKRALNEHWPAWRHAGQAAPAGDWSIWLIMAGRGFGKTRAGAEYVSEIARGGGAETRIALVGASVDEVRKVMVEGKSGLIAVAREGEAVEWTPTLGRVRFASGAQGFVYSGEAPEKLRGPEHGFAWCDEIAKWAQVEATWHNLQLGLRLGARPRTLITTTPRPIPLIGRLKEQVAVTRGRTADNLNLPDAFVAEMAAAYAGTRFGRQELDGEYIEDVEGALWTRALIERCRVTVGPLHHASHGPPPRAGEDLRRVVVGVDPPASASGTCGIVVCGLGADGFGYVLGDHSVSGLSPEGWARAVAFAAEAHGADRVVAENNQGGEMVESVLRSADVALPVTPVRARFGKARRAEPVAILFTRGKARFAGAFPELEDQLCGLTLGGPYAGPGKSPDRADAMVWALGELMLAPKRREPRIVQL